MSRVAADVLRVQDLHFAWEDGREVLSGLSLSVREGETVGIVGPNGAGKTTLFLLACGIVEPTEGTIEVFGLKPGSDALRGRVGIVFQSTEEQLFGSTVREDVAFAPVNLGLSDDETRRRVEEALCLVGLKGWEDRVPHHLSGGEKRKVAIAAVLAMRPELLLLDEPTSDLGTRSRKECIDILKGLAGTKIIATHDFEFLLDTADRVAVLSGGKIQLEGPPEQVFRKQEVLARWGIYVPRGVRALLGGENLPP